MPEPLVCLAPNQTSVWDFPTDPNAATPPTAHAASSGRTATTGSQNATLVPGRSTGTAELLSHIGNTTSVHFARNREATEGNGNSNAERVMSTAAELGTFNAGVTKDGQAVFVEAGLLHGARNGVGVELLSAGLQVGRTNEANAALLRMTVQSDDQRANLVVTTISATAASGERNPDGSANDNTTAQATLAGVELNQEFEGGASLTLGVALSAGLPDVQVWARDVDQDNDTEQCLRVSNGPLTVGGCIEPIVIARAARDLAVDFWNQL